MKIFKMFLHYILIILTVLCSGCARKNKQLSTVEIQESINEQVAIAKEYLSIGNNTQAIGLLENLLKQYPNATNIIEAIAFAHMDIGDPGLAAFYFEQIFNKDPQLHEYKIFAAQAYLEAKDYPQACRNYKNYLESFPNDRSTWKALARTYEHDKKDKLALEAYLQAEQLISSSSTEQDALKIARLYLKTKNEQEAKTWYHLVLTCNPKSMEARMRLLKLELQCENWAEAQKHLAKLESFPANKVDPGFMKLAKDIIQKKPSGKMKKSHNIASDNNDANAHFKEAKHFKNKGDLVKSIESYKNALTLNPRMANAWYELSLAYMDNKSPKDAELSAREAVSIDPGNLGYTLNYLKIIKTIGSKEDLLKELNIAKKRFPNNAELTLALAQAYHKVESDAVNAKIFYEEFLKQSPNHAKSGQVIKLLSSL